VAAGDPQRQRDVLVGAQVIEQAEILKHNADPAAQCRQRILVERRNIVTELGDQPPGRLQREKQQLEQRRLARPRWPGQELERMRLDAEREVAQDLRPQAIAQPYILESNHSRLRRLLPVPWARSMRPKAANRAFEGLSRREAG
jgi:hypothetical protein